MMCLLLGNRGWHLEIWNTDNTLDFENLDEIAAMNDTLDGYNMSYIDDAMYVYNIQKHLARVSGYFVAPYSGNFTFYIRGKQMAKMYLTAQNIRVSIDQWLGWIMLNFVTGYMKSYR